MKRTHNIVNIIIEENMDYDDYGQRLVECCRKVQSKNNILNIINITIDKYLMHDYQHVVHTVITDLFEMGVNNCKYTTTVKE